LTAGEAAMAMPIAMQVLQFFNEPVMAAKPMTPDRDRALDWHSHEANPMRLSPGESRLLQYLAQRPRQRDRHRMAISVEALVDEWPCSIAN
jgi:hypothetical protein